MAGKIFISYRREDEQGYAVRLYERLSETFGKERLFFDVDSIPIGFDFVSYIERQIGLSDVVLVVIGRNWLKATDDHGQRRLDNPEDFVRIEVESALEQKKHVIPVLVQGAAMPLSTQLPPKLQPLARRNAFFASHVGFRAETERLIASLQGMKELIEAERAHEERAVAARAAPRNDAAVSREPPRQPESEAKAAVADRGPVLHTAAPDLVARRTDMPEQDSRPSPARPGAAAPGATEAKAVTAAKTRAPARTSPPRRRRRLSAPRSFGGRFLLALLSMSALVAGVGGAYLGYNAVSLWPAPGVTRPPATAAPAAVQAEALIGMTIAEAESSTIGSFGVTDRKEATIVTDIDPKGAAFKAGIRLGYLILKVDGVDKFTRKQVLDAIAQAAASGAPTVDFTMRMGWQSYDMTITVELPRQ